MNKYNVLKNINSFIITLPVLWILTGLFTVHNGDKILVTLTLLSLLLTLITYKFDILKRNLKNKYLLILFVLLIYSALGEVFHFETPIIFRAIATILILTLFIPYDLISPKRISIYSLIGSIVSLSFVSYNIFILNIGRGSLDINPIPFSTYLCVLSVLSLVCFFCICDTKYKIICLLSVILSFIAVILTETRGTILALIITLALFAIYFIIKRSKNKKKSILFFIVISAFMVAISFPVLKERLYDRTAYEFSLIEKGNDGSSIGIRLSLWKAGLIIINKSPFSGTGNNFHNQIRTLEKDNLIYKNKRYDHYSHFHNQYIDIAVKWGVQSLIFLLLSLLVPLLTLNKEDDFTKISFYSLTSIFMIAGLTDPPLVNKQLFILFFTLLTMMYGKNKIK
ncbi:O-antigen ligase family protein [Photobacterium leiognathi subsp. mandapamensis]|uniref:O-antigen ligase family protein n=1 Tax=Photobacterium leiognathi TaxID=553611 RepID=UPI003AF3D226